MKTSRPLLIGTWLIVVLLTAVAAMYALDALDRSFDLRSRVVAVK